MLTSIFIPFPECYMTLESVKLEKKVMLHGQESKCYSVEPVLRCLPGCMPVRTTTAAVGYHCLPAGESARNGHSWITKLNCCTCTLSLTALPSSLFADSNLSRTEGLSSIYQKSADIQETAEAHLACRCTAQCA